ncbi:MAG: hypothetical protein JWN15_3795 [Firmicutes bacterium]|nr:hypothetical protein [Bacillota bacterium]
MPDANMAGDSADQEQPVYQGGAFTDIQGLGKSLGASVDRDPATARHTVNGQYIPWATAAGGQYRGSVHDIAQAAGGRVQRGSDGSYQVYKTAPTPQGNTSVTGNQPQPPAQMEPPVHIGPPAEMPQPGDLLRRLIGGGAPGIPSMPGMPGRPPITFPVQPPSQLYPIDGTPVASLPQGAVPVGQRFTAPPQSLGDLLRSRLPGTPPGRMHDMPMPGNPVPNPVPNPGDALRRVAPGFGGRVTAPGVPGRPPITSPVEPPRMSAMAAPGATDQQSPIAPLPGAQPGGPVIKPGIGTQPVGPAPQMSALSTGAQATSTTAPAAYQPPPGQTPAAAALGQRVMQGVSVPQQQIADPPSADTPPGWHWDPTPTPAAVDLGQRTMGQDNQVVVAAPGPANQPPPAQQPDGPQQYDMPAYNYQAQPIDYNAMQKQAQLEAQMWADPYLQQLRDAAALAQQRNLNERGYVNQGLQNDIGQLRAGEPAREQRVNSLMNNRGDALYGSGVHLGAIRDQQVATIQQEGNLTNKATNALQKLADNLGLTLQDITSKTNMITRQQGDKAFLTLQQLADKANTQQFENRKLAWQMWQGGAQLTIEQQKMANQLWTSNQQIKSADARAAADRSLKLAIASGQLEQKWAQFYGKDAQGNPSFEAQKWAQTQADDAVKAAGYTRMPDGSLVRSLDGRKFDLSAAQYMSQQTGYIIGMDGKALVDGQGQPVRNLEGAKFDWSKQQFIISEGDKVAYQNELIGLRQQGLITQQQHNSAMEDIQRGHLSIQNAQMIETNRHNVAMENKPPAGGNPNANANTAWTGVTGELGALTDPIKAANMNQAQRQAAAQAIVGRWMPQLGPQEQQALKQWLKANGLM